MLRKDRSRCVRLMSFEIGSMIFSSKWLFPRYKYSSLDGVEELGNSIDPVRSFTLRSRYDKKGIVVIEEGMVQEKWLPPRFRTTSMVRFCTSGKLPVSWLF